MGKRAKLSKNEAGFALVWVVVLLLVAGLILAPLLVLMTTGIRSAHFHEDIMLAFYAADAGIEDAVHKIQYNDPNLPPDTGESWDYTVDEQVNDYQVDVTIENLWILTGLETDEHGTTPHDELVTVGQIIEFDEEEGTGTYRIEMTYDASLPGELKLDRVGTWLPPGFSYVQDSSGGITSHNDVPDNPDQLPFRGGTALIWDFDKAIKFEELPPPGGGEPGYEFPVKRILYFEFTPAADPNGAFSWIRTNRSDIYLSWDLASGTYKVTSTAGDTTLESYIARAKLYERVSEIWGDYRAIGQSLMYDESGSGDDWWDYGIRDTLLFGADAKSATLNDIPDDAHIESADLYWSAWRRYPTDISDYTEEQLAGLADEVDRAKFWRRPVGETSVASWVTADRVQILPNRTSSGGPHGWSFSCRADVTDLITWNGNGKYKVKKIENPEGITEDDLDDQWSYAGWSLLIIYSSAEEEAHQLYLYEDFLYAHNDTTTELEGIEGFLAPEDADGRLTVFVGEGDDVWNGDKVKFNDNYLPYEDDPYETDPPTNPQNDVWNGKSSGIGGESIDGVDIDTFDVSPYVDPGDTEAEVELTTDDDSWNLVYVILSFRTVPGTETGLFPVRIMTYTHE